MKRIFFTLSLVAVLSLFAAPVFAATDPMCAHNATTIQSLRDCVDHAAQMGHISNEGVSTALLSQVDAAQAAYNQGQNVAAVNILRAFIATVKAQAGRGIDPMHAVHMIDHATKVIGALG